jgi:glutamine amidotransferase
VLGITDCGEKFVSAVAHGNVVGFQFHPEKSQANGLRLLDNFCGWDGRC